MSAALLPLAAALFAPDMPTAARLKGLAPFFAPAPGETLTLDTRELRDLGARTRPERLRGWLKVSPPPGVCLTVTRSPERPDERFCEPKTVAFTLGDLDRAGRLVWTVSTGDGDLGTEVTWPTPFRLAITTPFDKTETDPPVYKFLARCEADTDGQRRQLRIGLVTGETWIVAFPPQDKLEPQPNPIPNLFMQISSGKISVKEAAQQREIDDKAAAKKAATAGEAPPDENAAAEQEAAAQAREAAGQGEDRSIWSIPARDSYTMSGAGFMPFGSVPPGARGACRYNYNGPLEDPGTGRLECRDVDGFKHVLLPLTCLSDLKR